MKLESGYGQRDREERRWPRGILCGFCFTITLFHACWGTFAPLLGPLSFQELHLLFYFAGSVSKLSELHVWTEQPLSSGREGKERLQYQVKNCQVDIPRRLGPLS